MPELWLAVLEQWSYRTGGEIPVNFVLRVHLLHLLGDLVDRFFSTDNLGAMIGPMSDPSETDADDQLRFTVQFLYGDEPVPNVQRDIEFFPRMSYTLEEVVTLVEHTGLKEFSLHSGCQIGLGCQMWLDFFSVVIQH